MKKFFSMAGLFLLVGGLIMAQSLHIDPTSDSLKRNEWESVNKTTSIFNDAFAAEIHALNNVLFGNSGISGYNDSEQRRDVRLKGLKRTKSTTATDKATVVLINNNVWKDIKGKYQNTGYQMLLDADHDVYGDVFVERGSLSTEDVGDVRDSDLKRFEYKIPANADGKQDSRNIILDGQGSVEIPPGVYDYCIAHPVPGGGVEIANGGLGRHDDFVFEAGYTYTFEIEAYINGTDYTLHQGDIDVTVTEVILPENGTSLGWGDVEMVIENIGTQPATIRSCSYEIYINNIKQGDKFTEDYIGNELPAGESVSFKFNNKVDFSAKGKYNIYATVEVENDQDTWNNSVFGFTKHSTLLTVPFVDHFKTLQDVAARWYAIDANGDGNTWGYYNQENVPSTDGTPGFLTYRSSYYNADDYIIGDPVSLAAGDYHVKFYFGGSKYFPEALEVLFGTSMNPEDMTKLISFSDISNYNTDMSVWDQYSIIDFNVTEPGNYYFAFHAVSTANRMMLNVDEFSIAAGKYMEGTPDIAVHSIVLPPSGSVSPGESTVKAIVKNVGTSRIDGFTLTYRIDDGTPVTQTFSNKIEMHEKVEVAFDTKANFSTPGKIYEVEVTAKCSGQTNEENDVLSTEIAYFESAQIPFSTDFSKKEEAIKWTPLNSHAWEMDTNDQGEQVVYAALSVDEPLISQSISMKQGTYRMTYDYYAFHLNYIVSSLIDMTIGDNFYIICGKSDTDPATWKKISIVEDQTSTEIINGFVDLTIEEDGNYSIGFVSSQLVYFALKNVIIGQGVHDIGFEWPNMSYWLQPVAPYIPSTHVNGNCKFQQSVYNYGSFNEQDIKFEVKHNGNVIASAAPANLGVDKYREMLASGNLNIQEPKPGNVITLVGEISIQNVDDNPEDNKQEYTVHVTDTVFATENMKEFTKYFVHNGAVGIGNIFTLNKQDILTSISVGFGEIEEDNLDFVFRIFKIESQAVPFASYKFSRRNSSGLQTFALPEEKNMSAGVYYFEIYQTDAVNLAITYDEDPSGYFIGNDGQNPLSPAGGFGNICVRANFGYNSVGISYEEMDNTDLSFYYDSVTEMFEVKTSDMFINQIVIYDVAGKRMFDTGTLRTDNYQANVNGFAKGVYLATVTTETGMKTFKFIVK